MTFIKRGVLYCRRQRVRTLILFLVITCLSTFALTGLTILDAADKSAGNMRKEVGGIIRLTIDDENAPIDEEENDMGTIRTYMGDYVTDEIVKAVEKIKGVSGINSENERGFWGSGVDFDYIPGQYNMDANVPNTGVIDSEKCSAFQKGKFTLEKGRHIRKDDKGVIILSEEVAKRNNLSVGDKITLFNLDSNSEVKLKIIGIYSGAGGTGGDALLASDVPENAGFVDMNTMRENFGRELDGYPTVNIYVDDPAEIEKVCEEIKALPEIKGKTLKAEISNEDYESISNPLESMQNMISSVVKGILVVSLLILSLLLFLWTRSRKREVGILLAVGKSKGNIMGQLLTENYLVTVLGFITSYFLTMLIADKVCKFLVLGMSEGVDPLTVTIAASQMLLVYGAGILIITCCVAIASYTVIRLKPRDILSKMS